MKERSDNMNSKRGGLRSLASTVAIFGSFLGYAQACVQVELQSIHNSNGQITDYETPEDELSVWFGVGDSVLFTWKHTMEENQKREFPKGAITLPCFYDQVFYLELTELDVFINEQN